MGKLKINIISISLCILSSLGIYSKELSEKIQNSNLNSEIKTNTVPLIDWTNYWELSENFENCWECEYPSTLNPITIKTGEYRIFYRNGGNPSWDSKKDLLESKWDGTSWVGPTTIFANDVDYRSDVTATKVRGTNDIHVFYLNSNKSLIEAHWSDINKKWYRYDHNLKLDILMEFTKGSGDNSLHSTFNLTSTSHRNGAISVFYINSDYTLRQRYWNPDTKKWYNYNLGGSLSQGLSSVSMKDGRMDLYYIKVEVGENDGSTIIEYNLYNKYWENGSWSSDQKISLMSYLLEEEFFETGVDYYYKLSTISPKENRIDLVWSGIRENGAGELFNSYGVKSMENNLWSKSYSIDPPGYEGKNLEIWNEVGFGSSNNGRVDVFYFSSPEESIKQIKGLFPY